MAQRGVWQSHAVTAMAVPLVESRTPPKAQCVPACPHLHPPTVVRHANQAIAIVLLVPAADHDVDDSCLGLKRIVNQFGEGGTKALVTRISRGLNEVRGNNQRVLRGLEHTVRFAGIRSLLPAGSKPPRAQ